MICSSVRPVMAATFRGREGGDELCKVFEAVGVLGNVVVIDQAFAQEDVGDAIEQGDVGAGFYCEVNVGHHRGLGYARIDDE